MVVTWRVCLSFHWEFQIKYLICDEHLMRPHGTPAWPNAHIALGIEPPSTLGKQNWHAAVTHSPSLVPRTGALGHNAKRARRS